jgi:hypothetical protein
MVNQLLIGLCLTYLARNKEVISEAGIRKATTVQQSICNRQFFEEVIALAKLKSKELGRNVRNLSRNKTLLS